MKGPSHSHIHRDAESVTIGAGTCQAAAGFVFGTRNEEMDGAERRVDPRLRGERRKRLYCAMAIDALETDPDRVMKIACANIDLWEREETCSQYYVNRWRALIADTPDTIRNVILADTEEAISLCSNNPFAGVFSVSEARKIRAEADKCDGLS